MLAEQKYSNSNPSVVLGRFRWSCHLFGDFSDFTRVSSVGLVPDAAAEKPIKGEVIAAGNGRVLENGDVRNLDVKVGDKVLFGKYAGTEVKVEGYELVVMKE